LQFNRVRFSKRAQHLYGQVKHKTGLGINVAARYGLCLSLKDFSIPNPDEYDEKGMEITPGVLFGEHQNVYMALMIDRLHKDGLDPELYLHTMTRAHICRGAAALFPRISDLSDFNDIIQMEQK
jgi:DNA sulfur modification protein DndE